MPSPQQGSPGLCVHKLQQAAMELGEELAAEMVLYLKKLVRPVLTHLGHMLRLAASSYSSLSDKRRKKVVVTSWGNKSEWLTC